MDSGSPGWLRLKDAAARYGISYGTLWGLVSAGVLTRGKGKFDASTVRPRILVRADELDALQSGGVDAVKSLRAARAPLVTEPDGGK